MGEAFSLGGRTAFVGPWSTVWPLLLLPVVAHILLRPALDRIETMWGDPRWQTRASAAGASIPALVALGVAAGFSWTFRRMVPESMLCVLKIYGPVAIAVLLVSRALVLYQIRSLRLTRLLRLTRPPGIRLARLAREVGVPVRELESDSPVCFASGVRRPWVVVSTAVLDRLGDGDVRAALTHERAHLRRSDNLWALVVTILGETAFLSATKALRLYRRGREALADREAAREVERTALAGALVSMTRMAAPNPLAASFAEPDGLEQRVRLLLGFEDPRSIRAADKRAVLVRMAATASLALYPLAAPLLHGLFCHHP